MRTRSLLIALFSCTTIACSETAPVRPTNLLLVSIDTLRPDMLGCYGYERSTSPILDAFAAEGALFETALSTSPWTLPAHASLLTGLYPRVHGVRDHDTGLSPGIATLAQHLERRGFATAAFVNSPNLSRRYGLARGFRDFVYVEADVRRRAPTEVEQHALAWLADPPDEPFFLFLHFYDVHSDYVSLEEYERAFTHPYDGPVDGSTDQLMLHRLGQIKLGRRAAARLVDLYAAGIRQMDDGFGRVLDALERSGRAEETLVVLTSDHGEEFLEHGGVLHGATQFEEVMRIPLILRGPGVPAGLRSPLPVSLVDVVPSALAMLGAPAVGGLDGIDLSPILAGESPEGFADRRLFGEADHANDLTDRFHSVRSPDWKLVRDRHSGAVALYHLAEDPEERRDVVARHPERAAELEAELLHFAEGAARGEALEPLSDEEADQLRALGYLGDGS